MLWVAVLAGCASFAQPLKTRSPSPKDSAQQPGDHFGDPLPGRAVARLGTSRLHTQSPILGVALDAEAETLITVTSNAVPSWLTATGKALPHHRGYRFTGGLAVSPQDGLWAATTQDHGVVLLTSAGNEDAPLADALQATVSPVFSPKGRAFAAGGPDQKVRIWKVESREVIYTLEAHKADITAVAYAPDSQSLATADASGTLHLWHAQRGERLASFEPTRQPIVSLAYSDDSDTLAILEKSGAVVILDADSGARQRVFKTDLKEAQRIEFGNKNTLVVSGQGSVEVWDAAAGKRRQRLKTRGIAAVSGDGRVVAAGYGYTASLWILSLDQPWLKLNHHQSAITKAGFANRGVIAYTLTKAGTLRLWDTANGGMLRKENALDAAISPDGRDMLIAEADRLKVMDMATGKERWKTQSLGGRVKTVLYDHEGTHIYGVVANKGLMKWQASNGALATRVQDTEKVGAALAASADGRHLATALGPKVQLRSAKYGSVEQSFDADHGAPVEALAFSPNGLWMASGSKDGVVVRNLGPGQHKPLKLDVSVGVRSLSFVPDNQRLGVGFDDGSLQIWHLPSEKRLTHFKAHHGQVASVDFGLGGNVMLSAGEDGTAIVWDMVLAQPAQFFEVEPASQAQVMDRGALPLGALGRLGSTDLHHDDIVVRVAHAPGPSRLLATAAADGTLRLWHAGSGAFHAEFEGHQGALRHLLFSPDGRRLVGVDSAGRTLLWDTADGTMLRLFEDMDVSVVAFDTKGQRLALAGSGPTIHVWELASNELVAELTRHDKPITGLSFSPFKNRLASSSLDGTVVVWNLSKVEPIWWAKDMEGGALSVAYSPTKRVLAAGAGNKRVRRWDTRTGEELEPIVTYTEPQQLFFMSQGQTLLIGGALYASIWDVQKNLELQTFALPSAQVSHISPDPNGQRVVTASGEHTVRFWDVLSGEERFVVNGHQAPVSAIARSKDGTLLTTGSRDGGIIVWDLSSRAARHVLRGHKGAITDLLFSPTRPLMASSSADGSVCTWSITDGTRKLSFDAHKGAVTGVVFTPDGRSMVTAGADGALVLWNVATGLELARLGQVEGAQAITSMTVAGNGEDIIYGSADGVIRVWSAVNYKLRATLRGHMEPVNHLVYAPRGNVMASVDTLGRLLIWKMDKGRVTSEINTVGVMGMVFAPDGKLLATIGAEAIHIWDIATGREVQRIDQPGVTDLIFAGDGQKLFTASQDTTVLEWDLSMALPYEEAARQRAIKARQNAPKPPAQEGGAPVAPPAAPEAPAKDAPAPPAAPKEAPSAPPTPVEGENPAPAAPAQPPGGQP